MTGTRKLAAIFVADAVGFSRHAGAASIALRFAGALGFALALAGCAAAPPPRPAYSWSDAALARVRLDPAAATARLNAYRADKGLRPVRLDPALTAMAARQAQAMAASGTMSHDVAGSFSTRLAAGGIRPPAAENLGEGYTSFDDALAGWRASPAHAANLLMADASRFGVALAKSADGPYWAMVMAAE